MNPIQMTNQLRSAQTKYRYRQLSTTICLRSGHAQLIFLTEKLRDDKIWALESEMQRYG